MAENIVVTKSQIQDVIKSEGLKPSDLFGTDQILADPIVKGFAEDRVRERIGSEYQRRKSLEEELEKVKKDFEPKEQKYKEEIKKLKIDTAKTQLGSLLDKEKEKRSLDDRQIKFIQERHDRFNPSDSEKIEQEYSNYLDKEIDEYNKLKTVFGIEEPGEPQPKPGGAEPEVKREKVTDNKYVDPAQNPMIKTE
ncbi:MAG: hypothetical protein ACFFBD_10125 [Candidatus Hodarchaeota archaeon]